MTAAKQKRKLELTARQKKIYEFLKDRILNRGYGPTVREIGHHVGLQSTNAVVWQLKALEAKGLITREPNRSRAIQLAASPRQRLTLPLVGQIVQGKPLAPVKGTRRADFRKLFDDESHFCLKVKGDSMAADLFADGDCVLVRPQETCRDGEIVVAMLDGREVVLKRFHREKNRIRLEPVHTRARPIHSNDVEILGVVVGLIRQC